MTDRPAPPPLRVVLHAAHTYLRDAARHPDATTDTQAMCRLAASAVEWAMRGERGRLGP